MKIANFLRSIILPLAAAVFVMTSCGTVKDITYFQNKVLNDPQKIDKHAGIVIQPNDKLSIVVSSRNPELAGMFNLSAASGGSSLESAGSTGGALGYVVDKQGQIDFPVLGILDVSGLTRGELSDMIKKRLLKDGLLNDAVVTVEFLNFKVSVLGEVNAPGTYEVDGDRITILEALSRAGDLTIFGLRENVTVMRERNGQRTFYQVNLCGVDMFKSPAYFLEQNDVIYVEPNQEKAKESTIDNKTFRIVAIATSSASLLVSLVNLIVNLAR